jgi:hypothetical protein
MNPVECFFRDLSTDCARYEGFTRAPKILEALEGYPAELDFTPVR